MNKTHFEIVEVDRVHLTVDVSMIASGGMFFNATEMAKSFGKLPNDYLRLPATDAYMSALKESDAGFSRIEFVTTKRGGKHQGTWLHKKLALDFARWLSPKFAVALDGWTESRLSEEYSRKQSRLAAKTGYLPMAEAIESAHDPAEHYHFSNEANLINRIVLGMTAKEFKEANGVENVRDACSGWQLSKIEKLQRINTGLIELGMGYEERKEALQGYFDDRQRLAA
ncbi:MAG: KilA-N domain-containing protein [Desulfobulbaceae bacterium]|nr:KilA-N domain-containing protein [Desulfobulbaceae bacterium]